ncbi:hypothetical protein BDA96_07G012000 [Sorghum bicolor]|uniref:F-box domain-containing protein n=2 Tax=Sorghum bicolor TaxID=4558 RepID=A0A921QKF0_SORBI|nr:hypothetical protein BDA96_07G012000 [Sorghum bicolor]KXG24227.1 hypothetical protein SORBI_3007G011500 [Sorghum bicolor]
MVMESTTPSSEEDLISQLPSDVLVSILEKLSLRAAVRAGVLSRRWRCLPAQLPRLVLDIAKFLPRNDPAAAAVEVENADPDGEEDGDAAHGPAAVDDPNDDDDDDLYDAGDEMANAATALLASSWRPPLDAAAVHNTVAMRFYLRHNYMELGRLLDDAVASGRVRKVSLTITTTYPMFEDDRDSESIHRTLVGYGRRFKALLDACPAIFGPHLTELTLEKMRHGGPDLLDGGILATCTRLEKLTLENFGPERGWLWRVRHAWLKHIKVILCFPSAIQLLWLPRLESFTLRGWFWTTDKLVSLGHVPRLTTMTLTGDIVVDETVRLSRILANSTALTDLRLNFSGSNIWVRPETSRRLTDAFSKLKNLKLKNVNRECGLAWTMFLLQSAPHLQELYIKLMEHNCCGLAGRKNVPWEVDSSFKHYNLAAVNLEEICFCENAESLCSYCDLPDPDAGAKFPRTDQERDSFTKRIITDDDGRSTTAVKIHIRS